LRDFFGLVTQDQLRTVMFLQLVAGGHLLLFITRTRWFFLPPFPAATLFTAILLTQILAVVMCGVGWLVPSIPWTLIGWVWVYNIVWMFVLGGIRLLTECFAAYRTARQAKSVRVVDQSLQLPAAA
jgi:H+-transporting ATPase